MMLFKHIEMKDGLCRLCVIVLPCFEFFLGPTAAILYVANMEPLFDAGFGSVQERTVD